MPANLKVSNANYLNLGVQIGWRCSNWSKIQMRTVTAYAVASGGVRSGCVRPGTLQEVDNTIALWAQG